MKKEKFIHVFAFLMPLFFFLLVIGIGILVKQDINSERRKYESHMGQRVVVGLDTATVVNYSLFMKTFTLSNGMTVDESFILK